MPKKRSVETLMDSQQSKASETLLKSAQQYFAHIFWSLWKRMSSKNSFLVVSIILRQFLNIFTPNGQYSLSKSEWLTQPIQMQLSENRKKFSEFFAAFGKST